MRILDLHQQGISLERLMQFIGERRQLDKEFSDARFQEHVQLGYQEQSLWLKK